MTREPAGGLVVCVAGSQDSGAQAPANGNALDVCKLRCTSPRLSPNSWRGRSVSLAPGNGGKPYLIIT